VNSLEGTCLPVDQVAYQQRAVGRTLPSKHIDAVVFFARLLLFAVIYLQKIALGPKLGVSTLIMLGGVVWLLVAHHASLSPLRLGLNLLFSACCTVALSFGGPIVSPISYLQLIAVNVIMTLQTNIPEEDYIHRILGTFVKLMILPAIIVLLQYGMQKLLGLPDLLNMEKLLPSGMLLKGYYYSNPYPLWTSTFTRPNGFFFLEPSTVSLFTATAAVIEMTYFRRRALIGLMLGATMLSFGGTGFMVLLIAVPMLIIRSVPPHVTILLGIGIGVALIGATSVGVQLPLISRVDELKGTGDSPSGAQRLTIPAEQLLTLLTDPEYLVAGSGPGSTSQTEFGSAWPILKVIHEYGLLAMLSYIAFYISVICGNRDNVPLKIAFVVIFQFTGGYLVSELAIGLMTIICMNKPARSSSLSYGGTRL
jgi:hypothetical protein